MCFKISIRITFLIYSVLNAFNLPKSSLWIFAIIKVIFQNKDFSMSNDTTYSKEQAQEIADTLKNAWYELTDGSESDFTKQLFESIDKLTHKALPQDEADEIAHFLKRNLNFSDDIDYLKNYNQQEFAKTMNSEQNSNSQQNTKNSSQSQNESPKEQEKQQYSNFEKRQFFEESLNSYDEMLKSNKDFEKLHSSREQSDKINDEIARNDKDIIEKEQEIKQKQEKLDELERQKNKKAQFNGDDIDENDPLAQEKKELQALKEKSMALKEQKIQCEQSISESVGKIAAANDVYEVYKNLIIIYRKLKEAQGINKNLQYNKERMKELDEKINGYTQKLNEVFKKAGLTKEGKELLNEFTKDLYIAQKESKAQQQEITKQYKFYQDFDILFKQRENTTNLESNTNAISKLYAKVQNESPNFQKNYANTFKKATTILQSKDKAQEKTQYQGRSA